MNNLSKAKPARHVAVLGGCGTGLTMSGVDVPGPGETVTGARFAAGPGGKGSNQAIAVRRLGIAVDFCSSVGDDSYADELRALWRAESVGDASVCVGTRPTMVGVILVDDEGENRIMIAPGALDELGTAAISDFAPRIETSAALLVSLEIPLEAAYAALACAQTAGVRVVFNPAPGQPLPAEVLAAVDHLIPNRTEAAALTGLAPDARPDTLVDALRKLYVGVVVLTLGAEGALVDDGVTRERVPAVSVGPTVDTTGAGDAFCAAYTAALVWGAQPVEAARLAAGAGGFAVTQEGAVPGLPYATDLKEQPAAAGAVVTRDRAGRLGGSARGGTAPFPLHVHFN
jgi:ribokinase